MNIVGKLLLFIGILVGASIALAVGITFYFFNSLSEHGVSPGTSYSGDYEYEYRQDFAQSFDATGKTQFEIRNSIGKVHIVGWDENVVEIQGTLNGSDERVLEELEIAYYEEGSRLRVEVPDRKGTNIHKWSVDFVIHVPTAMEIFADQGVGDLRIEQISTAGRIMIDYGVGEVEVVNVQANIFSLDVGVGDVFLDAVIAEHMTLELGIGDLEFHVPRTSNYYASMSVGVGDLDIEGFDFPGVYIQERGFMSRSAEIELGDGSDSLSIDVGMGQITFRIEDDD